MQLLEYPRQQDEIARIFARSEARSGDAEQVVGEILREVRTRGDDAVMDFTRKFDRFALTQKTMRVDPKTCKAAWKRLPKEVAAALEFAREGIEAFHRKQVRKGFVLKRDGARLEQRLRPLRRIGVYVPGGLAAYPSTLLMNVIPAQVAGVKEIVVVTPPVKGSAEDFVPFAAAHLLGVSDRVYQIGGAQAVAALAYGTETIPKVDKVVGPGNIYVGTAKRMLYGVIDIDSVAAESEVLIIADETAKPSHIAADLLAQAEHPGESVIVVGIGRKFDFTAVERELDAQLARSPRREHCEKCLNSGGSVFIRVQNAKQAAEVSNLKAPEHLEIIAREADAILELIENAGAVFLGAYTPEPIGDYVAGPNHVLPTGGTARFFSPLGVDDFLKSMNVLEYSKKAFQRAAPHVIALAESEGLPAHAESIRARK